MDLFESFSVDDNVRLAREASLAGGSVTRQIFSSRGDRAKIERAVEEALRLCGLSEIGDAPAWSLPTGKRRLLGLARCLAAQFRIIMLDEASAGLDRRETAEFGRLLRMITTQMGRGIVLVEHDMSLVMSVCDEIYVLDFGKEIMHGTAAVIQGSPEVRAAYLGEEVGEEVGAERGADVGAGD
jgi:ABC-type branched-subunit amino acid transport system ATPase component